MSGWDGGDGTLHAVASRALLEDDTSHPILPMWIAITVSAFLVILSGLFAGESFAEISCAVTHFLLGK